MAEKIGFDAHSIPSKGKIAWMIKVEQKKVGSQWKIKEISTQTVTKEWYLNTVSESTIKWFRRLGGSETVKWSYTPYGYIPWEVISTSPGKEDRVIYQFFFGDRGKSYMSWLADWKAKQEKEKSIRAKKKVPAPFGL